MKKIPKAYWVLFELIEGKLRQLVTSSPRPGSMNPLYGLPEPANQDKGPEPTANERYWLKWFRAFTEIDASLARLIEAHVYLTHFPGTKAFRFHRVTEAEWLRYHVEVHFHEMYILYQRLMALLRTVRRLTARNQDHQSARILSELENAVRASFKGIVDARGTHVHEHRFEDYELRNLDLAILFSRSRSRIPILRAVRQERYRDALTKWDEQVLKNMDEVIKGLVFIFKEVADVLQRNEPPAK